MRRQVLTWTLIVTALFAFILVPFALFDEPISAWTLKYLRGGCLPCASWVIVGALAADVFLPIPSSIVSTLAGTLLGFPLGLAASWLGMTIGSVAGYWFGATAARAAVEKAAGAEGLSRASQLCERYGSWALVASRPVPVLAEATVIAAGSMKMPFLRFALWNALSNLGVSAVYAYTGAFAADRQSFFLAFAGALTLPGLAMLTMRYLRRA